MKPYAERPGRLTAQLVADLLALAWLAGGIWLAAAIREQVLRLQVLGEQLVRAGGSVSGAFRDAAGTADRLPLIGDELADALGRGTRAGQAITGAGRDQVEAVAELGTGIAVLVIVVAVLPLLLWWLPARWRYARAAGAAAAVRDSDADLLALRALVDVPARRLLRVAADPAAAWRAGDTVVCTRLADLRLAELGLRGVRVRRK